MVRKHYALIIMGLADHKSDGAEKLQSFWRRRGLECEIYRPIWRDSTAFEPKLEKLIKRIDDLESSGWRVSLIGISAGASAALNAYVRRPEKIHKVVFVCGKLAKLNSINPINFQRNPPFKGSIEMLPASIRRLSAADKAKMVSLQPLYDGRVSVPSTKIEGIRNKLLLSAGHVLSIIVALTVYSGFIIKFIKAGDD